MSDSVRPHGQQPSRLLCPQASPGKNSGVGCHVLLQIRLLGMSKKATDLEAGRGGKVNYRSWWWTRRPGVLQFTGSQRVGHVWATELNWVEGNRGGRRRGKYLAQAQIATRGPGQWGSKVEERSWLNSFNSIFNLGLTRRRTSSGRRSDWRGRALESRRRGFAPGPQDVVPQVRGIALGQPTYYPRPSWIRRIFWNPESTSRAIGHKSPA